MTDQKEHTASLEVRPFGFIHTALNTVVIHRTPFGTGGFFPFHQFQGGTKGIAGARGVRGS